MPEKEARIIPIHENTGDRPDDFTQQYDAHLNRSPSKRIEAVLLDNNQYFKDKVERLEREQKELRRLERAEYGRYELQINTFFSTLISSLGGYFISGRSWPFALQEDAAQAVGLILIVISIVLGIVKPSVLTLIWSKFHNRSSG